MPERMCCTEPPGVWAGALCALEAAGWLTTMSEVPSGGGRGAWPVMMTVVFAAGLRVCDG